MLGRAAVGLQVCGGVVKEQGAQQPPLPSPPLPPHIRLCNAGGSTCVHIKAAGRVVGFTPKLRGAAAAHLLQQDRIAVDAITGICSCAALADEGKKVYFRPKENFCTCHDRTLHSTCCHLQAAPYLAAFRGLELLGAAMHIVSEDVTVSAVHAGKQRLRG